MTDQTNLEDKIREILDGEGSDADKIQAIYDDLLPPPLPDPLFLAKATHPKWGEGVVISHFPDGARKVRLYFRSDRSSDGTSFRWVNPSELTFHTSEDHPVFLETEEDYQTAPEGTIVAEDGKEPYTYLSYSWRGTASGLRFDLDVMAGTRRRVLRWGKHNQ